MNYRKTMLLGATLAIAASAQAHHSFSMFDNDKEQTIEGVVKEFQWTNPHIWVQVNVTGTGGKLTEYSIEGGSPNGLRRQGWTQKTMKPGDKIVLKMHPLKDGSPGGSFVSATVNGKPVGRARGGEEGRPAAAEPAYQ
ncbi:MAG: DUF6152 family protein [Steroidobacteraceae bacterium]